MATALLILPNFVIILAGLAWNAAGLPLPGDRKSVV
jgi:hypothetical protein